MAAGGYRHHSLLVVTPREITTGVGATGVDEASLTFSLTLNTGIL